MPLALSIINLDGFDALCGDTINGISVLLVIDAVLIAIAILGQLFGCQRPEKQNG